MVCKCFPTDDLVLLKKVADVGAVKGVKKSYLTAIKYYKNKTKMDTKV